MQGEETKSEKSQWAERHKRYRKNKQKIKSEIRQSELNMSKDLELSDLNPKPQTRKGTKEAQPREEKSISAIESRGSVLAEKHVETLEAFLKAYKARLKATQTLEQIWRRYPNPKNEVRQLELYKRLLQATQALADQIVRSQETKIELEDPKVAMEEENLERPLSMPTMEMEVPSFVPSLKDKSRKYPTFHVPEMEDKCANRL